MKRIIGRIALLFLFAAGTVRAGSVSQVTRFGITWQFDKPYECGQFANGDWWVKGPVTITGITPAFDGTHHGWQVNPQVESPHGFDYRVNGFDAAKVPALPYTALPGQSLVKGVSIAPLDGSCRPCLEEADVLTVVGEVPPDSGATVFRPPYAGDAKPVYSVNDLHTELLPSVAPVADAPTLSRIESDFARVHLDHKPGWTGAGIHPAQNMPEYGSSVSINNTEGALRLLLNDSVASKRQALINYVQYGIDTYFMALYGRTWEADGGHGWGRMIPLTFAAVLLDNQDMKDFISTAEDHVFAESYAVYFSPQANNGQGQVLYGEPTPWCDVYWTKLVDHNSSGSKTCPDPYGYIDGGECVGCTYDFCCSAQPMKQITMALHIFPELMTVWNDDRIVRYADRWVTHGAWAQPDPCAPADGFWRGTGPKNGQRCTSSMPSPDNGDTCIQSMDNFGITFGDDPGKPGDCIRDTDPSDGIGRYPQNHGTSTNGGYYGSSFANQVWDTYRDSIFTAGIKATPQGQILHDRPVMVSTQNPGRLPVVVDYSVFRQQPVRITVHDGKGRQVAELVNRMHQPGSHRVVWDGKDRQDNPAPGGIMYLAIHTGPMPVVRKIILLD